MATITSAKKVSLDKMNRRAAEVGLGTLIDSYAGSHKILAAGNFTTVGGDANEAITVTGATSSDFAIAVVKTVGATPRTILTAAAATNAVNLVFSGDPAADHVVTYLVLRVVS